MHAGWSEPHDKRGAMGASLHLVHQEVDQDGDRCWWAYGRGRGTKGHAVSVSFFLQTRLSVDAIEESGCKGQRVAHLPRTERASSLPLKHTYALLQEVAGLTVDP